MRFFKRICDYYNRRQKQVINKESITARLRKWIWYNSPYFLLIITTISLLTFIGLCFWIIGGSSLESGTYYNHLQNCATIIGGDII